MGIKEGARTRRIQDEKRIAYLHSRKGIIESGIKGKDTIMRCGKLHGLSKNAKPYLLQEDVDLIISNHQLYLNSDPLKNDESNRATFLNVDCSYLSFKNANLWSARFIGVNLIGADFSGANLKGCNFSTVDMDYSDFTGAYLHGTYFFCTSFSDVKFNNVIINE